MLTRDVTKFIVPSGVMCEYDFFISKMVCGTYFSKRPWNHSTGPSVFHFALVMYSGTTRLIQLWAMLFHCMASEM